MKHKKTIGILGGMGPGASANLYQKIIEIVGKEYGAVQDTDFPPMVLYNLPLFGFDETGFANPTLVKKQLIEGVKKLENAESDFIVIACNTVHYFYEDMQRAIKIPIISIIEETAKEVRKKGIQTIGLVSSESTKKLKIYQKALETKKIKTVEVKSAGQKTINAIILAVMGGKAGKTEKTNLKKIIAGLREGGAEGIVLGCTELPLAIQQKDVDMPLFDSTEIMARAALRYALEVLK